uniref:Uncharacterized protein n=1 Tax=Anguilla anguilla TaxID=7936 RepID=A0A0E9R890_ANGAN
MVTGVDSLNCASCGWHYSV